MPLFNMPINESFSFRHDTHQYDALASGFRETPSNKQFPRSTSTPAQALFFLCLRKERETGIRMELLQVTTPVDAALFPSLAMLLLSGGAFTTFGFFLQEVTSSKNEKNTFAEMTLATISSMLLGFGAFFLILWVGVYV
ncbi:hypothetical protein BSKO_03495 [Bryopsis sp. KO-2023]|nr:hypothetical protein BSKO_03495 [Bryopsis sp. KO-2023]